MSMTSALNNALSGLNAVGRSAQLVSSNISNALTPGYGRRELAQSSGPMGGVQVNGIQRMVDAVVLSDRRLADAAVAQGGATTGFLDRLSDLIGAPDDPGALTGRLTSFEGRLLEAASRPDSSTRLQAVVDGAKDLVARVNSIGAGIQAERQAADRAIGRDVDMLNTTLVEVKQLNSSIARLSVMNDDASALHDQRQVLIDRIAELVPVRQIPRDNGAVALMTTGGQVMLDSFAATFEFSVSNAVTTGMSLAGGQLSGLSMNGQAIAMNTGSGRFDGGRLAGHFEVRDALAPGAQADLDAFAQDLIQRFEAAGIDPTRAVGDPGLFTDAGAALAASPPEGLAQRLSLNSLADPAQGGMASRLRDGLGAGAAGNVGNGAILQALSDSLNDSRATDLGISLSASGYASELMSRNSGTLFRAEQSQSFSQNRADALREQELLNGVDTDQEMQKLLQIEQSYAANARVIQVVDDMMRRLLEI
ncbi:flagellar hook-associated protein FlgK [Oceaniglobus ichthyenteri]|uniref:flagellar hook-associated protein FlgK n=1 Tax=Oceaniglobus ichthyenteri TaxID=2136177 RepID=UPI000D3D9F70|nr:flagellar hook-associated protein FlgK [Oceaniglobus ichthyenteri]